MSRVDGYTYLEQTGWSNFNEGCDLKATVEDFHRKFGYYPEAVLTGKVYQTRENRRYCKALGIHLSGPPLGRKRAGEAGAKETRQMRMDACERNGIESSNGVAKRRYGLNLIMAKLNETAKTEAVIVIFAMNAAHRLRRWLLRFFKFSSFWAVFQ